MAAFDAGRIVATADLDRSPFQRSADELRAEGRKLAGEKFTPKVDADTSEADRKVIDLRGRLDRLNAERVNPTVDLEGVTAAEARLAGLQAQLDHLNRTGGGAGGGGRGGLTGGRGGFLSRFPKGPGFLALGIGAALPMAGPLAGVAAGGAASFLSPTVAGGIGLAAFAAGAKASYTAVGNDVKKLVVLQQRYNAAATDKQRAAVLRQEHQLWASLDPAERKAVRNVQDLHTAWQQYQKALQPQSFGVLAEGAKIAEKGLRLLLPTAKGVGNEVENLASTADTALSKPFWRHFFHDFLAVEAPMAVHVLGTALGSTVSGIARLSEKFAPLGHDLENMLLNTSSGFDKWTKGGGPARFVAFVEKEGPIVARDLHGLARALEGLGKGLAPIGQVELKALGPVLDFIGKVGDEHPAVITAVGTALLGVGAGLKVIAGVRGIQGILGGIGGLRGGAAGGVLGGISKASPVPVYVVNEGFGGMPGGGGGGGVGGGGGRGGKFAGIAGLGLPLTAAYLATQGGDVGHNPAAQNANAGAIGQALLPILRAIAASGIAGSANNRTSPGAVAYDKIFSGRVDDPHGQHVNVSQAVGFIQAYGGQKAIAQLNTLAQKYPEVAAGVKQYNSQVSGLNKLLQINAGQSDHARGSTDKLGGATSRLPGVFGAASHAAGAFTGALQRVAAEAAIEGAIIGHNLGQGLIQGVEALIPHATFAGKLLVSSTVKNMRIAAEQNSPSKATMRIGVGLGEGLIVGFQKMEPLIKAAFTRGTTGNIHSIETAAANVVARAQAALDRARNKLANDRTARHDYIANLTSSFEGYGNIGGAINPNGSVGNVSGFLRSRIQKLRKFVDDLRKLRRRGLSPALIQEVADLGVDGGLAEAQSILSGESGPIRQLNRLERQVESYGKQGATIAGNGVFNGRIRDDVTAIHEQTKEVKLLRQDLHELVTVAKNNPHAFAAALDHVMHNSQHHALAAAS